jgi:FkbM family methyltransferase
MSACIVDVGGGKSKYYKTWLERYPLLKIYCFEPHPDKYNKLCTLKENFNANCQRRIKIINKAVSNTRDEKIKFHINNDPSSSSLFPFNKKNIYKWKYPLGKRAFKTIKTIDVECTTLNDFFTKENIKVCELLIIDTQGDSLNVLKSLSYENCNRIKRILVKVHICEFEIYEGQSAHEHVNTFLRRRYFQLNNSTSFSRGQEQIMYYLHSIKKNRGIHYLSLEGIKE